jgi:hypothetical protein
MPKIKINIPKIAGISVVTDLISFEDESITAKTIKTAP